MDVIAEWIPACWSAVDTAYGELILRKGIAFAVKSRAITIKPVLSNYPFVKWNMWPAERHDSTVVSLKR